MNKDDRAAWLVPLAVIIIGLPAVTFGLWWILEGVISQDLPLEIDIERSREHPVFAFAANSLGLAIGLVAGLATIYLANVAVRMTRRQNELIAIDLVRPDLERFRADYHGLAIAVENVAVAGGAVAQAVDAYLSQQPIPGEHWDTKGFEPARHPVFVAREDLRERVEAVMGSADAYARCYAEDQASATLDDIVDDERPRAILEYDVEALAKSIVVLKSERADRDSIAALNRHLHHCLRDAAAVGSGSVAYTYYARGRAVDEAAERLVSAVEEVRSALRGADPILTGLVEENLARIAQDARARPSLERLDAFYRHRSADERLVKIETAIDALIAMQNWARGSILISPDQEADLQGHDIVPGTKDFEDAIVRASPRLPSFFVDVHGDGEKPGRSWYSERILYRPGIDMSAAAHPDDYPPTRDERRSIQGADCGRETGIDGRTRQSDRRGDIFAESTLKVNAHGYAFQGAFADVVTILGCLVSTDRLEESLRSYVQYWTDNRMVAERLARRFRQGVEPSALSTGAFDTPKPGG